MDFEGFFAKIWTVESLECAPFETRGEGKVFT
jgi:hypothetical protein